MAALTPTNATSDAAARGVSSEFGGALKMQILTIDTISTASDTVTLVQATDKIRTIRAVMAQITAGLDANCTIIQPSFSGLVITLKTLKADGATAADDWTGVVVRLIVWGE